MDFKKLLQQIDNIENKKTTLTEASMNISFNADTADEVGTMLDRLKGVASASPAPTSSNMGADMQKFRAALGGMEGPPEPSVPAIANAPDEKYGGIDTVIASGDDMHKSKNPADLRVKDPSGYEASAEEDWANAPEEKHSDHNTMIKDLSGGINREKKMFKPAAKGDNPMSVADETTFESIRDRLINALNEKKAKPDFLDMDKDGNKKEPMKKALKDKKVKEAFDNWGDEDESEPERGDIVQLYSVVDDDDNPIRGIVVGPGKEGPGSFAIKFKNTMGKVVVDTFHASDEFKVIKKANTGMSEAKKSKPDFLDMDKDGNKKEPMKKAVADKKKL